MMGGPPPTSAGAPPGLSSIKGSPSGTTSGGDEGGGTVPKLVFSLEKALGTLAQAVPGASDEVEQIKGLLRQILMKATQGGGAAKPGRPGLMSPSGAGGAPNY